MFVFKMFVFDRYGSSAVRIVEPLINAGIYSSYAIALSAYRPLSSSDAAR